MLEHKAAEPGFWNDQNKAQAAMQELNGVRQQLEQVTRWIAIAADFEPMLELAEDPAFLEELLKTLTTLEKELENWELTQLLSGPYDDSPAIVSISAGAGGTDAADWALMLLRMYQRWAEQNGFKTELTEISDNEEAGIKSATIIVTGPYAYGRLQAEKGIHRLVRMSPFNAAGKRQTSFAGFEIVPELNQEIDIDINPIDLRIDTFRSGGAGGQNVNKVESAIRITHLPTGTVVSCQNERSQLHNKETAMKVLKSKLYDRMVAEHAKHLADLKGPNTDAAWGNQIRSYVFHPYTMVKDHRTGEETSQVQAVMDGDINAFIDAFLRARAKGTLQKAGEQAEV
jgi:peptide chain release factor 2